MEKIHPFIIDLIISFLKNSNDVFSAFSTCKAFRKREKFLKQLDLKKNLKYPSKILRFEKLEKLSVPGSFDLKLIPQLKHLRKISFVPTSCLDFDHVNANFFF